MSFALTKFKAYGIRADGAVRPHVQQVAVFTITAANTDVALDIQTLAGTFWTAAIANTTYGALATAVRSVVFTNITGIINKLIAIESEELLTRLQVATATSGTEYAVAVTASLPGLTFVSGSAPTAITIELRWTVDDGKEAVAADYGAQVT